MDQPSTTRLLRPADVQAITTLNRTTIWEKVRDGTFPKPIKISGVRKAWRAADIETWIADCAAQTGAATRVGEH